MSEVLSIARASFAEKLSENNINLLRTKPKILQINVGKLCNLTCFHCHVNAGPKRKEIITRNTVDKILKWIEPTDIPVVDLTGGAPEMIPDFKYLVSSLKKQNNVRHIIDRCNLTILLDAEFCGLAEFLADNKIEIVASMPCYEPKSVNAQRGDGVFDSSIAALKLLNDLGYGKEEELPLNLVYNPVGTHLPPDQGELEKDYKDELIKHYDIIFNKLYTITNMPIARYLSYLKRNGQYEDYMNLLVDNFNPNAVEGLMCRDTISVSWKGEIFDCDFNQMLDMPMGGSKSRFLWDLDWISLEGKSINLENHCFGCTAGAGSSCSGSLS